MLHHLFKMIRHFCFYGGILHASMLCEDRGKVITRVDSHLTGQHQ